MPPAKQAYHSAYRTNSHSLRSTNACGHKPKKQFCKSSVFYSSKIIKNDPKILLYGPQINQIKQIIFLISKIMWESSVRLFEQRCHIDGENSCLLLLLIIFCGDKETFAYAGWNLFPSKQPLCQIDWYMQIFDEFFRLSALFYCCKYRPSALFAHRYIRLSALFL